MALSKQDIEALVLDYQTDYNLVRVCTKWGKSKADMRALLYRLKVYKTGHDPRKATKRHQPRSNFGLRIAQNIWYNLADKGLTTSDIAKFLQVTPNRVSMIKAGYHLPDARELMGFALLARVPIDAFYDRILMEQTYDLNPTEEPIENKDSL